MLKKTAVLLSVLALTFGTFSGCKTSRPDTAEYLEIVAWDAGYGVQWLDDIAAEFKQQDWVKQKYQNLEVDVSSTKLATVAETKIPAGAKNNSVDLFFAPGMYSLFEPDMDGNDQLLDLTERVYNQIVPGEKVLYKDKILASYLKSMRSADANSALAEKYFAAPWASGMDGILYNADYLKDMGIAVPLTTDELLTACETIKTMKDNSLGKYALGYSFITSHEADYSNYVFPVWWAQYQTVQGFENFYQGIDGNKISRGIFRQEGRLYAARVLENIFSAKKGYNYEYFKNTEYMVAQTMFLQGKGVFMMNGDWFDNEMRATAERVKEQEGLDYDIRFMKTPILSAIVDQTPSIVSYASEHGMTNDEALSMVVRAVDNNLGAPEGIDVVDYERIAEARQVIHTIGPSHMAVIPSYASAKDSAVDFLRFMATDVANVIYSRAMSGGTLPFKINIAELAPDVYQNASKLQKSRIDIFGDGSKADILPIDMAYPLRRFGNVGYFYNVNTFVDVMGSANNAKTAQTIYEETLAYWTAERWNAAKTSAGIVG